MRKLFNSKSFLIGLTLILGLTIGWFLKPSNDQTILSSADQASENLVFTCSMHPQIRQGEPGDCPICGMDLIPLDNQGGESLDPMAVSMSPTAMQLANVQTAVVGGMNPIKRISLNGKIQADERQVYTQTAHFAGRVERLMVNFTGEYVQKGSTVAYLYSPQLVTAQEELFEAFKIQESQPQIYRAAREKLKNLKLTEAQIDAIISSGSAKEEFPVNSDYSGVVLNKIVNLGAHLNEGEAIYKIADLSKVWALFDVYESDLSLVEKGDSVSFTVASIPGKTFEGVIDFIDPVIDSQSRVAKARVMVKNTEGKLKPEMFASAVVSAALQEAGSQLVVPKSSVMWTGKRSVVYVKNESNSGLHFQMREVVLGSALDNSYIIESGLETGEEIAVNGTFSIDAAAQLAGKPSMMSPEGGVAMTGHNHGGESPKNSNESPQQIVPEINKMTKTMEVPSVFSDQLKAVFSDYISLKVQLVNSDAIASAEAATKLHENLEKVDMSLVSGDAHLEWMKDLEVLEKTSQAIADEQSLENQRILFSPLSDQLYNTLSRFQVNVKAYRQYCPMAMNYEGAYWISTSEKIRNPYFGDQMLTCGSVKEEL
jgi:Cu(I)/Ag(I) efflux system membrane fusion protein